MHQLELIPAPPAPKMPPGPIVRSAEIDGDCRWTLRRAWGPGPSILWCGLNPSTADGTKDDPTMLREIGFSFRWGFGSLVKVNMYPFIASKPVVMRAWRRQAGANDAIRDNVARVRAEIRKASTCVAAWGGGASRDETVDFLSRLTWDGEVDPAWKCLGTNADTSPIHTLARGRRRVPDDAVLLDWDGSMFEKGEYE